MVDLPSQFIIELQSLGLMKQSLEKRITVFAFVILSMTIMASTAMEIIAIRKDYIKDIQLRSETIGTSLKTSIEKVLALGIKISDINGLGEKCRESIQPDPDMAYCIITDVNGAILFFSEKQLGDPVTTKDLLLLSKTSQNKNSSAQLSTNRGNYFDTLTPILSFDSSTAANIHIGFPESTIDKKVRAIVMRSVLVFLVFFSISFATVVIFVKKCIIAPISTLLDSVIKISQGNYDSKIEQLTILEFDELAQNINQMSDSLESRGKELKKNYDELTSTHSHLHNSYLQLEALSLELEKSKELFKKIIEESGDAILIIDKSEHVLIANKMVGELFDLSPESIPGQHISSIMLAIQSENISHLLNSINRAFDKPTISEEIVFTSHQQLRTGRLDMSSISQGDKNLLQLVIRDITRERKIITNLEESAAGLTRLNKMKDSFLGLASHELKTPLTVILGYAELLQNDMKDQMSENALEMVTNISNAAMRLDGIIKDMIDVSMLDQNQIGLKRAKLDLNELIESTVRELKFFFALRKQDVYLNLSSNLPMYDGDKLRLTQMLTNIIGNAIKFTPDGGKVTVTTTLQKVIQGCSSDNVSEIGSTQVTKRYQDAIQITITDTGIGINKDDQVRIFEKFYEAGNIEEHSTGKVAFKSRGTGLGLSIAKGIAEVHGGQIWVESAGHDQNTLPGSIFYILLPLETDRIFENIML